MEGDEIRMPLTSSDMTAERLEKLKELFIGPLIGLNVQKKHLLKR